MWIELPSEAHYQRFISEKITGGGGGGGGGGGLNSAPFRFKISKGE